MQVRNDGQLRLLRPKCLSIQKPLGCTEDSGPWVIIATAVGAAAAAAEAEPMHAEALEYGILYSLMGFS